jgi:molybdopterin-guanine dinucleotide biosynthesis protein A
MEGESERAPAGDPALRAIGAVIAGGHGSRIGGEKAVVELGGRPLISHPLAAVEAAGLEPLVVAKSDSELPPLRCTVIREDREPRHPLCGILTALEFSGRRPVVAVGCDMPFLEAPLLAWLAARAEPLVAPSLDDRILPFPGRYRQSLRSGLERALAEERSMGEALAALSPRLLAGPELAAFGDPERLCFNVNTREDLARAEALLDQAPA